MEPVIAGIGETDYSFNSGRSELQLAAEACLAAMRDAGVGPADVDGLVTFTMDDSDELELQRCLGIPFLRWASRSPFGGVGSNATIQQAAAAIRAGYARAVLVFRALNGRSGRRYGSPESSKAHGMKGRQGPNLHYAVGLDTGAKSYAAELQHYLRRHAVSSADLGQYVVSTRAYAATNPRSIFHGRPLALAEHQASRWIVEPWLRRHDCCIENDGGAALLITSADMARDLRQAPVRVLAATQGAAIGKRIAYDVYRTPAEREAEARAVNEEIFRQSGMWPGEADLAMLYDAFSPSVFVLLEAYGICDTGEARPFILEGQTGLAGIMPVNPNGGLLGEAYLHGVNNIIEAVRQLRGDAANQVAGAETALVGGGGTLLLAR